MARGRMISKIISLDEKVDALSNDTVRLLFTWLIPHLDCEGRMFGDAQTVKSIVFPRRSMNVRTMQKYLDELVKSGLIQRYADTKGTYICCPNFEKHQKGLRKQQEAPSQIPPFTTDLKRCNNGFTPIQVETKEETKVETKEEVKEKTKQKESSVQFLKSINDVRTLYQDNILLGATIPEDMEYELKIACGRYSPDWVYDAISEAIFQNHPDWGYLIGILRKWSKYGRKLG